MVKKTQSIVVICLMLFTLTGCGNEATAEKDKKVTSTDDQITLTVPGNFTTGEQNGDDGIVLAAENDKQSVGAYVYKLEKSPLMSFDEFCAEYAALSSSTISEIEVTTIDGKNAKTGQLEGDGKFSIALIDMSEDSTYLVMAGASQEDLYDKEAMQTIVKSVEINAE